MNLELLEEAKRRYPVGTTISSLGGSSDQTITHDEPYFVDRWNDDRIRFNEDQLVYVNGNWAKIISSSNIISSNEDYKYLIKFFKRLNIC